jgi:hypothetical protein
MSFLARWALATVFVAVMTLWIKYGLMYAIWIMALVALVGICGLVIAVSSYAGDPRDHE